MYFKKQFKNIISLFIILVIATIYAPVFSQRGAYQNESSETKSERMQWYQDARFGMFIHWGAYSQLDGEYKGKKQKDPKGEWIMRNLKIPVDEYALEIAATFNPKNFDADKWVKTAKDAGMKYLVMTTKHHDGFALFDSDVSDFNIVDSSPFKRDVIKELAEACRKYGLKFGIYYSQAQDWHHAGGLAPKNRWDEKQEGEWTDYFESIVKGQVTELFTNYGEISLIWWDSGRQAQDKEVADAVGSELVKLQPDIIVNPRLGGHLKGDFNTFEQVIPAVFNQEYNEICITHNRSWSYKPSDNNWKTPEFLLKTLVHTASMGGNFLFNVGPNQDGEFPKQTTEALKYIGDWIKINGESIYGTQANPFYKLDFGEATIKSKNGKAKLYLFVYNWPEDQELFVKGLHNKPANVSILGSDIKIKTHKEKEGVYLKSLPKEAPDEVVSVIVLEIDKPLKIDAGYIVPSLDESIMLTPLNGLLTIKPQFDCIPTITEKNENAFFDNWKNCYPHPRFKNTGNKAHWKVKILENGVYKVKATVATRNNKNIVSVSGENYMKTSLPDTGGMDIFKEVVIGELKLKKGLNTITFTGGKKDEVWDFVRLNRIVLEKVN
jgi:alpha-L-fucosidase